MCMSRSYGKRNGKAIQKISYIRFNPKYLLKGEEPPVCIPCDRLCSIEHLLTGCVDLMDWRRQFFKTESLSVLFRECSPNSIIQFLKCTNLFNKLTLLCTLVLLL